MSGGESVDDGITSHDEEDRLVVLSSSEDDRVDNVEEWYDPRGDQPKITTFVGPSGPRAENLNSISNITTAACYELLAPNVLFEEIARRTNFYVSERSKETNAPNLGEWTRTTKDEIKRFFGLIIWMGLVRLPSLSLYWSLDPVYLQTFPRKVMPKNRFEILLQTIYFADKRRCRSSDYLYKIESLVQTLEENYKKYYVPAKDICIDESLIPFCDRISLKQHMKHKRFKYGIRIFKLCCASGYTYALRVFNGKFLNKRNMSPMKIAKTLCNDLFDKGYTLYTDRWYTSLKLANKLIAKNTHLVGTLRTSRRGNPEEVVSKKLRQGEMFARENKAGITVLKWRDGRNTLLLSTKHSAEMVYVKSRSGPMSIPRVVFDYNIGKPAVDLSDRMNAYNNPITNSVKWYRKVAFELLLNVTVKNSFILYKTMTKENICLADFRKKLAEYLIQCGDEDVSSNIPTKTVEIMIRY